MGYAPMEFIPAVYEHAATLLGERPWTVSRSAALLARAHAEAYRRYHHSPVVVGIDIYSIEAEAYGALIQEPEGNAIPAISSHPCAGVDAIPGLPLLDPGRDGRLPLVLAAARELRARFPEADIRIPLSGPFSIAGNLIGLDTLLLEVLGSPEATRRALVHLVEGQLAFCRHSADAGLDVTFFESGAAPPLLSPRLFREIVLPPLRHCMEHASRILGHPVPCIIGGNTLPILDALLETGTGSIICPSETDQRAFMELMQNHPEVAVRVNMNPGVFLSGSWDVIRQEVQRVVALARLHPHASVGTGVLPFETDPTIVLATAHLVSTL